MTVASWYISLHISSGLIFSGRDNRQPDNMDILADIFYISNFTKMGHSTMQIFYEIGLVDKLLRLAVCSFVHSLFEHLNCRIKTNQCPVINRMPISLQFPCVNC